MTIAVHGTFDPEKLIKAFLEVSEGQTVKITKVEGGTNEENAERNKSSEGHTKADGLSEAPP